MKTNELQIGDYVNYRGQVIKVTSLYDKGGSNEVGWSNKESVWVNADNVEPIPLTPEILEKNGFVEKSERYWVLSDEYIGDEVLVLLEVANGFAMTNVGMTIGLQNVHELQHLFRLCGIDKEIIL